MAGSGISCGKDGAFVGEVPLLERPRDPNVLWAAFLRPAVETARGRNMASSEEIKSIKEPTIPEETLALHKFFVPIRNAIFASSMIGFGKTQQIRTPISTVISCG